MGLLSGIGQSISNGVDWVGDKAKAVGHTAGVVWDDTKSIGNATPALKGMAGGEIRDKSLGWGFDDWTIEGYPGKWSAPEAVPGPVTVHIPFERGAQQAAAGANAPAGSGTATTVQTPLMSFVYLDVGRWGGTESKLQRDFGIVCGRTAVLCAFATGSGGRTIGHYTDVPLPDTPADEIGPIKKLIAKLGGTALGTPKVRKVVQSKRPRPAGVSSLAQNIYVIVGDMHLPAVTELPGQASGDPEQQALKGQRFGRVRQRDIGKADDEMADDDATYWHQCYIKGEIFQKAGQDLSLFAGVLKAAQGNVDAHLWLLQLGDMFDLWLGFDRYFNADPPFLSMRKGNTGQVLVDDDPPKKSTPSAANDVSNTPTTPRSFVEMWVNRTMKNTTESDHVVDFLKFPLSNSKFLYGNHDNYLAKVVPSNLAQYRGSTYAKDHKEKGVLYACHGHQFDSSNRDGALFGVAATQTAFWGGTFIRSLEPDSRADTFKGAATLLWKKMEDFAIFAMGHTHCPLLVEVQIVMDPEPPPDDSPGTD